MIACNRAGNRGTLNRRKRHRGGRCRLGRGDCCHGSRQLRQGASGGKRRVKMGGDGGDVGIVAQQAAEAHLYPIRLGQGLRHLPHEQAVEAKFEEGRLGIRHS